MSAEPRIGFDQRYSPLRSIPLGGQHLLALTGLWVFPISLGTALDLTAQQVSYIIQGCFLLTGIVTVLSSSRILKLPIVQGPTAALLVALITAGATHGLGVAFGSMAVAGLLSMLLAFPMKRLGLYGHVAKFVANPLVFGTMFLVLGAQLAGIGVSGWFTSTENGTLTTSIIVAVIAISVIAACMLFGRKTLFKTAAVLWGIIAGTITAMLLGTWTFPDLTSTPILGAPQFLPFGFGLEWSVVPLMMIGFLQAAGESMGVYGLLGRWGRQTISIDRNNRGLFVEFAGSAFGALFGGIGSTSYPENAGVLRITGVASRTVTIAAGVSAIAISFLPPVAMFLANLPGPALSAAATVLFGVIAFSGVQQLASVDWDDLNLLVAALSFAVPLGLQTVPEDSLAEVPSMLGDILSSPMMMSTIMLLTLHPLVNYAIRPLLRRTTDSPDPVEEPSTSAAGHSR
ncbi:MAG: uracil-xanthine permease family protein [Pseudoclavibacter sp.]